MTDDKYAKILRRLEALEAHYDTGWIACSDWTNQHLGDTVGGNVAHNLQAPLSELAVKVLISTDGTDNNSFDVTYSDIYTAANYGITIFAVDKNNIKVQTGQNGITYTNDSGQNITIDTESWYYKVKVHHSA